MRHTNIIYIKLIIKPIALFMLWAVSSLATVYAQVYPVQVVTEITPPYSVYLSDYTSPGTGKLAVNILLTDVLKFGYPVKLRLVIEGEGITIATSPSYMPEPITLDGGSPLRLAGDEVADYFNPRNLDFRGYSRERFMQTGALPEGIYRIGFQAMDYNKGIAVSLAGSATAWLVLNDPPIFNTPEQNAKLTATEPQSIMFQWMPRHLGSPNSAFSAEYVFELYEVWPDGRNPNEVVASTQPLVEETVTSTSFFYSNTTAAALMPGRGYAYRVQARDVEGRDLFRNKGYSEVQLFTYGDPCDPPAQVSAQSTTSSRATISWEPSAYNTGYYIQYREAGSTNGQWYPKTTCLSSVIIDNLKPKTRYEYQVQGQCGTVNSDFSEMLSVTTQPRKEAKVVCGLQDPATAIKSTLPLTSLLPGDTISSGSMVTQVTQATGGNGKWTGEGFMHVPFMGVKIHVTFKNISINDKNQVTRGRVVSVYNPGSNFIVQLGGNKPDTTAAPPSPPDTTTTTVTLPSPIDTIVKTDTGEILVITENGDTTTVQISLEGKITVVSPTGETTPIKGDEVTIVEPNGDTTVIDREGNITVESKGDKIDTEEDKPFALVDRDFLYITIEGRTDTLYNGHTLNLTSQDTTLKLKVGFRKKELYTKAYKTLDLKKIKKVRLPLNWADSINTNHTQWKHSASNVTGKEFLLNLRNSGSSKLYLDASKALNVIFNYEYDTITRKDTLIRGNRIIKNKIEVNINIAETGTLLFKPKNENYYLDYGFDDALSIQCQQSGDYNPKLTISKADYYVPWLGVLPNTEAEIKLEYLTKDMTQDSLIILECSKPNLVFPATNSNYLSVPSFESKNIILKIKGPDIYYIDAYSLNKQKVKTHIGRLKVESKDYDDSKKKPVRIILLKRSDETSFPIVNKQLLIDEVNNQGYKQAFVRFVLDNSVYRDTLTIAKSSRDSVKLKWLVPEVLNMISTKGIYYIFITSQGINRNNGESRIGVSDKIIILAGTTHYAVTSHELGHSLGLQHTWQANHDGGLNVLNQKGRVLIPELSTKNIMDYIYSSDPEHRRYFFLFQINHLKNQ